jgi:protein-disulfide isomerase-like protein with CxxC motif
MPARVTYITDPACAASWGVEPMVRRLMADFGDELRWTFVMGGLAREWVPADRAKLTQNWLDQADRTRMPFDPLIWRDAPLKSSYPASMACKAAADQSPDDGGYGYLRALCEGVFCFRRKLDTADALIDLAGRTGLDTDRFRLDLNSNAVVEAFGMDLEIARDVPAEARAAGQVETASGKERVPLPTMYFTGERGARHDVYGAAPYADYLAAAEAAGAHPATASKPTVQEALARFGRMATREVEEVCGLKGPRAEGELWQLALDFEVKPTRVLTGWLWEPAH